MSIAHKDQATASNIWTVHRGIFLGKTRRIGDIEVVHPKDSCIMSLERRLKCNQVKFGHLSTSKYVQVTRLNTNIRTF